MVVELDNLCCDETVHAAYLTREAAVDAADAMLLKPSRVNGELHVVETNLYLDDDYEVTNGKVES